MVNFGLVSESIKVSIMVSAEQRDMLFSTHGNSDYQCSVNDTTYRYNSLPSNVVFE